MALLRGALSRFGFLLEKRPGLAKPISAFPFPMAAGELGNIDGRPIQKTDWSGPFRVPSKDPLVVLSVRFAGTAVALAEIEVGRAGGTHGGRGDRRLAGPADLFPTLQPELAKFGRGGLR